MSFKPFGSVKVEWPGKIDGKHLYHPPKGGKCFVLWTSYRILWSVHLHDLWHFGVFTSLFFVGWPVYNFTNNTVSHHVVSLGYVYLVFDSEKSVKALLAACTHDFSNGGDWYFKISSRRMRCKEVMELWQAITKCASSFPDITYLGVLAPQSHDMNLVVFRNSLRAENKHMISNKAHLRLNVDHYQERRFFGP